MNNFFAYLKKEENLHFDQIAEFLDVVSEHIRLNHPLVYAQVVEEFKRNSIGHHKKATLPEESSNNNHQFISKS